MAHIYRWYGRIPRAYDAAVYVAFLGQASSLRRRAVESLAPRAGDRVLDLACGPGMNLPLLSEKVGGTGSVVAVDQSAEMLRAARARPGLERHVELVEADATRLPLPDASLDAALCTLGLSAMPDHRAAILAVRRALRAGGRFVVLDASPYRGALRVLNPARNLGFRYGASADATKDIVGALRDEFDTVEVEHFLAGSMFLARADLRAEHRHGKGGAHEREGDYGRT